MTDYSALIEEKMTLLRRIRDIGEKLEALAGKLLGQGQEDGDSFDGFLRERMECLDQIDAIDRSLPDGTVYDSAGLKEMIDLLQSISATDKAAIEQLTRDTASLKQQIGAQMERKKSMIVYGTNIMARTSMILDEEK